MIDPRWTLTSMLFCHRERVANLGAFGSLRLGILGRLEIRLKWVLRRLILMHLDRERVCQIQLSRCIRLLSEVIDMSKDARLPSDPA